MTEIKARLRAVAARPWVWLLVCILLAAPVGSRSPGVALDESWALGLNLARIDGLHYGPQIVFTYGPWGYLDVPLNISRLNLLLGGAFAVGAAASGWFGFFGALRRAMPAVAAAVGSAALVTVLAHGALAGDLLFIGAGLVALNYVVAVPGPRTGWIPAGTAVVASLLTQVKFSEGLVLAVAAVTCAVFGPSQRARRAIEVVFAYAVGTCGWWLLAGQSLADLVRWFHGSFEIASGYTDALSYEAFPHSAIAYALLIAVVIVLAGQVALAARAESARVVSGVALTSGALLYLGFREGYNRHDLGHEGFFYLVATGLLTWWVGWPAGRSSALLDRIGRRTRGLLRIGARPLSVCVCVATLLLGCLVARQAFYESGRHAVGSIFLVLAAAVILAVYGNGLFRSCCVLAVAALMAMYAVPLTPRTVARDWALEARTLVDRSYLDHRATVAAQAVRAHFAVPTSALLTVGRHPVAVDNYDTSVVWAYGLTWRPAPVFQQLSAYTPYLDRLNATSITDAPVDQMILRAPDAIDGRNPLWDPPRYVLTELCNYRRAGNDANWLLLRKATNRCSAPTGMPEEAVDAGAPVTVPTAQSGQAVIMSFEPSSPSLLDKAERFLFKPRHPLYVHTSDATGTNDFRLPRALATGPLIVRFPATAGWPAEFGGTDSYDHVSFSESGTVTFKIVSLR